MTPGLLLFILLLLQIKHFLADWMWQTAWMVRNKATWGHPGGIAHAAVHAGLTLPILVYAGLGFRVALLVAAIEAAIHYHLDWFKARHAKRTGQTPEDQDFWVWMGVDQFGHQVTYLAILWFVLQDA